MPLGTRRAESPRPPYPTALSRRRSALQQLLATLPRPVGGIITAVTVSTAGRSSAARTGRTRADRPIVAAVARITGDGRRRVALTGVAAVPVLIEGRD